jgi:RND superfamily putative drug exporter
VAVVIDAFIIRMTLIPALMYLLGERAWWLPRWLDRLLPEVDVEGEKLQAHLAAQREVAAAAAGAGALSGTAGTAGDVDDDRDPVPAGR